jgi:hypothetical protein
VRPIADLALDEAEPSLTKARGGPLDAVVMIGHHAATPSPLGFCSHTFIWEMEVRSTVSRSARCRSYAQGLAAEGIPVLARPATAGCSRTSARASWAAPAWWQPRRD